MKIKKVCSNCGSENIVADAYAVWSIELQNWELAGVYDNTTCIDCEVEDEIEDIEIEN